MGINIDGVQCDEVDDSAPNREANQEERSSAYALTRKQLTDSLIRQLQYWYAGQEGPSGFEPFLAACYRYARRSKAIWDEVHDCFWIAESDEQFEEWEQEFEETCGF